MKCPYKKIRKLIREKEMIVEDQFDFGDCDKFDCMAYYKIKAMHSGEPIPKCKMLEEGNSKQINGGIS